MKQSDDANI
jgi:hypothetical protein